MRAIVDNDAILKLARYGLLYNLQKWAGKKGVPLLRLGSCPFVLCKSAKGFKSCGSQEVADLIQSFCDKTPVVNPPINTDVLQALALIPGINEGEQVIFGACFEDEHCIAITGDKISIRALGSDPSLYEISTKLSGKIYCMEQILAEFIDEFGYKEISAAVRSSPETDNAIGNIFGRSKVASIESAWEGLTSYYSSLQKETTMHLLADFPKAPF